jgi:NADPH:quinone reductase-like Zn-dependent oxidoreductase
MDIPDTNRSIILPAYNPNLIRALRSLKVESMKTIKPKGDEVLIKVIASPCNPSDIAFIQGGYNIVKPLPAIPGFEGTGIVVASGSFTEAKRLVGRKVSFFSQEPDGGTWSEFVTTRSRNCILTREDLPPEQAACLFVNPFTAYALYDIIRKKKAKSIILNAAAGQIGIFIQKLARNDDITIINIVRKEKHIAYLKSLGEKIVINKAEDNFESTLQSLSKELQPSVALDAIGGEMTGRLFNCLPGGSETIVYGGLSGTYISNIGPMGLIFGRKKLSGFNLNDWLARRSRSRLEEISSHLQELIIKQEIRTRVQAKAGLEDHDRLLTQYIRNMSDGKVLFFPEH